MKTRKLIRLSLLIAGLLAFAVPVAFGSPIYFAGTDHYYELVEQSGLNWDAADTAAQTKSHLGTPGYLATITSAAENTFVTDNLLLSKELDVRGYWLGGLQAQGSGEPDDGWEWVTLETWLYTNWYTGEPNDDPDTNENEDRLEILNSVEVTGMWNDIAGENTDLWGYVVEYPIPEPASLALLLLGGLTLLRRRRST